MSAGRRRFTHVVAVLGTATLAVVDLHAQAWLPAKGTTSVALSYQYIFVKQHNLARGELADVGHIHAHATTLQLFYSPASRLEVSAGLPYVVANYRGPLPHQLPIDNGTYHSTWQDYRFDVKYQATSGIVAMAPFISEVLPSHHYTYFAHSAVGRDLRETSIGSYFGVTDLFTHFRTCGCPSSTYAQARVAYASMERTLGIRTWRTNADLDIGYFANEKFSVRGLGSYARTYGGENWNDWNGNKLSPFYLNHDKLLNERHLMLGGGASYAVSDRLDVVASIQHAMWGRNGHRVDIASNFGVSWSFGPTAH
ncbi:MAG TPA: hypothetical protein VF980_14920 [Thermoanaerobaculia bacterium]